MNSSDSGGVVMRRKRYPRNTPTSMGSLQQEMQHNLHSFYSDDQYSDVGFPALPRPKTVVSLASRATLPWNFTQASHNTLPVRTRKIENQVVASDIVAATSPVKINRDSSHMSLLKHSKRKSLNGTSDICNCKELAKDKPILCRPISYCEKSSVVSTNMSNHSRVQSRKGQVVTPSSAACGDGVNEGPQLTTKVKKSRKPGKSLTFSFGSSSERKRRTLGFLGKGDKKLVGGAKTATTPDSPILVSRKVSTLPAYTRTTGLAIPGGQKEWKEVQVHPSDQFHDPTQSGSYQDTTKSPSRGKHRPPPLTALSSSASTGHQIFFHTEKEEEEEEGDSPDLPNYSPALTSTTLSREDSSDSLSYSAKSDLSPPVVRLSASNPSSRRQSPNLPRSNLKQCMNQESSVSAASHARKLSDPTVLTTEEASSKTPTTGRNPQGSTLKKRYTFCVKPSRQNPSPGWKEMRQHVVRFLVETELSYVESLKTILKVYYEPLRKPQAAALVEPSLVKNIFYQIPEICSLHERFLQQLTERVEHWDTQRKIGDIFVNTFSRCHLMDIYRKFIGNFMKAKSSIEIAKQTKSVFSKFLEQRARDSEGKLTLDDLLIKPVQRIPRYVLFVKDLLKHTGPSHPDHAPLQQALGELIMLAGKVNESERERERIGYHKELLNSVDGLAHLLSPHSCFLRYDMITEVKGNVQKRDRFLILYSDILVCACSRRKSSGFKRSSLLNLNSVFSDSFKYNIKWHLPLTKVSVAQTQALSFDRRRQNTVEKMLENLQKDDSILQQMLDMSTVIHHPHQALMATLRELQSDIREGMVTKKAELDNLPLECTRIDLLGYASAPPTQYTVLFPSQKIRDSWEEEFLRAKKTADSEAPPTTSVAPPTSPLPNQITRIGVSQDLEFLNSVILQSSRVGMQLTCAVEGLAVDSNSSSCLWVCCNDGFGGQVSLLDLQPTTSHSQVVANITISDSHITCISAIPSSSSAPPPPHLTSPPNISISTSSSGTSSLNSDHVTLSPTLSSSSDIKSVPSDKDDELIFLEGDLDLGGGIMPTTCANALVQSLPTDSLTVHGITRVRSNSAPPFPDIGMEVDRRVPSPATGQQHMSAQGSSSIDSTSTRRLWPALTLRPSSLEGVEKECEHCMWLGTDGGQIHLYRVGNSLRSRTSRKTIDLGSAVHCIRHFNGSVYVGLGDGTLAELDASDPTTSSSFHRVEVGSEPVRCCVSVMGELWVSCEGSFYRLDPATHSVKVVCTLPSDQVIEDVVAMGNSLWVSVRRSSLLHLLHAPSGHLITSVDCTRPVVEVLKSYDPIIRQHKSASLYITSIKSSNSLLLVGTSAGIVLAIPSPFIEPSLEPCSLLLPPTPTPLYHGHVDQVHFLSVVQKEGVPLVITGGNGCEDFRSSNIVQGVPDTASCILLWTCK